MNKDKASVHDMSETEYQHAKRGHGGKGSGIKSRRTRKRQELIAEQERHAMDKPKKLETQTDGDLSEVKKDPVWKTWLEKYNENEKEYNRKRDIKFRQSFGDFTGDSDKMTPTPEQIENRRIKEAKEEAREAYKKDTKRRRRKKAWEVWLDNITKPIPDSKGGRGSFQHCINANQDKRNPGGWCKQIERKIGKAKKQTKIDKPKDWWDHSKVGTKTGWDDDPMNKPSYFQAKMEEERKKKREAKEKKYTPKHPMTRVRQGESELRQEQRKTKPHKFCPTCGDKMPYGTRRRVEEKEREAKEKGRTSRDRKRRQQEYVEAETANLKDKTDKCPSCEGRGTKTYPDPKIVDFSRGTFPASAFTRIDCPGCKGRGKLTPTQQQDKDAKEADDKQYKKLTDKTDYFVEEIRSNIIYHNKILPLVGMIAGQAARGMGKAGKKIGGELLEGASEVGQGMLQAAEEEEEQ